MTNAAIWQCQFLQGFLLSPMSVYMETKMLRQHLLALADILKQFVNLSHELTGIHEFVFAVTEVVKHVVEIVFLVILRDLLHGRQPLWRRLHAGVSSRWGPRVAGRGLKMRAGCPGRHPRRVTHSLGRQRPLPAFQRAGPVHLTALGIGVQRRGQEALEHAAHLREQRGRAGVPGVLLTRGVLPKCGKTLLLLARVYRLHVILKTLMRMLLLGLCWEFLPGDEHVASVVRGGWGQRRHPALVGVPQDPAFFRAQPHSCTRGKQRKQQAFSVTWRVTQAK